MQRALATMAIVDAQSQDQLASHDAIASARAAFEAAMRSGDAAMAAASYADDATLVAPATEIVHGRAAIERFWRTGVETGIADVQMVELELQHRGDFAFEVGTYELHVSPESGAPVIDRGRYLIVHRVEPDGHWRRAAEMFSPDPGSTPDHP
jgi:uncharacterized protein (TIGR02246 family)